MFEHLINNAEQFRNEVIEANRELHNIEELMRIENNSYSLGSKKLIMKEFLKAQDRVNNLYRVNREDLYR